MIVCDKCSKLANRVIKSITAQCEAQADIELVNFTADTKNPKNLCEGCLPGFKAHISNFFPPAQQVVYPILSGGGLPISGHVSGYVSGKVVV